MESGRPDTDVLAEAEVWANAPNLRANLSPSVFGTPGACLQPRMTHWLRLLMWTAMVLLPGGVLLVPVVLADRLSRRSQPQRAES